MVAVPVWADRVTMNVLPLPATVGVTLTPLNTPDVKLADVPVIPAVPLYATVETKLVTVLLFISCAVMVIPVIAVPAVCGDEIPDIAKGSNAPGENLIFPLVTAVKVTPPDAVAVNVSVSDF